MDQFHAVKLDQHVERFTHGGKPNHFSLPAEDDKKGIIPGNIGDEKVRGGKISFVIQPLDRPAKQQHKPTFASLLEEVKATN